MSQHNPSSRASSTVSNRSIIRWLMAGHLVNDWVFGTLWFLAPAIAASYGLGPVEVGLLLTVSMVASGIIYIPAGILSDRMSNQGILLLITFWWVAIGYFCASFAPGFWGITLLLAFGSMGDAFWHPVATGVLVKRMPERRAHVLGLHAMGGSAGAEILGPLSAGFLLGFFDWRLTLQILVIPAVIMGIAFIPLARRISTETKRSMSRQEFGVLIRHWLEPAGLSMMVLMILYNMSVNGMYAMTPLTLQQTYQISPFVAGILFAGTLVMGTACQPLTGKISDRVGRKPVIISMILFAGFFALSAGLVSNFWLFVCCLILAISALTAVRPAILAAAVEYAGKAESTTLGVVFAVLDGVGACGALLAGYAGEWDLSYAYLLGAILAFSAVTVAMLVTFTNQQDQHT